MAMRIFRLRRCLRKRRLRAESPIPWRARPARPRWRSRTIGCICTACARTLSVEQRRADHAAQSWRCHDRARRRTRRAPRIHAMEGVGCHQIAHRSPRRPRLRRGTAGARRSVHHPHGSAAHAVCRRGGRRARAAVQGRVHRLRVRRRGDGAPGRIRRGRSRSCIGWCGRADTSTRTGAFVFAYHGYPHHYFNATVHGIRNAFGAFRVLETGVAPFHGAAFTLRSVTP